MRCALSLIEQPVADLDPEPRQLVDLREQRLRIDDYAVADDARDAVVQDAGRDQMQDELLAVHVDGVPGVVSALIARDDRKLRRQQIDDLALAFVTPLRAKNHDVHRFRYFMRRRQGLHDGSSRYVSGVLTPVMPNG